MERSREWWTKFYKMADENPDMQLGKIRELLDKEEKTSEPKIVIAGETMGAFGIEVDTYICRDCYTGDIGPDSGMVGFRMIAHLTFVHKLADADACRILLDAKEEEKEDDPTLIRCPECRKADVSQIMMISDPEQFYCNNCKAHFRVELNVFGK